MVLLDYGLPGINGLEAIARIKEAFAAPVTIVSANDDGPTIRNAITGGAAGFIPKTMSKREFFAALGLVRAGVVYLPPQVLFGSRQGGADLSDLQRRILSAILRGKSADGIAVELGIGESDVEAHTKHAFRVLGVDNRIDALYELASRGVRLGS
jgi:DNA-binding NarL/FixJ family response regulator